MDAPALANEFALRKKSYLWKFTDPDPLAGWVLADSEPWAEFDA